MLAVLPGYRDGGIGRKLKLAQRRAALAQGITEMRWTFDPLQGKNAYFNIAVLGGTARDYRTDVYGPSTSAFNRGLPTDRLILRWDLRRPRGRRCSPAEVAGMKTVSIPFDVNTLRERNLRAVLSERLRVRREFARAFRAGWEVTGFASDGAAESRYVLTKRRER
jgi:predicted GNAT superfamily acetyltransferase